ncbi:hypothetical protein D3C76_1480000 [compost metagenome]
MPLFQLVPPRVTPWYRVTSSPISAVSPMTMPMPWSMKKRRPMVAPGWISMPVSQRPKLDTRRASHLKSRFHRALPRRCSQMACMPG